MTLRTLAVFLLTLSATGTARAQALDTPAIEARCGLVDEYVARTGPVQGSIRRLPSGYDINLFVMAQASRSPVGELLDQPADEGFVSLVLQSPTLDLEDPGRVVHSVSVRARSVAAEVGPSRWGVQLLTDGRTQRYASGGDQTVRIDTQWTNYPRRGAGPILVLINRGADTPASAVFQRFVAAEVMTAEFYEPRTLTSPRRLFVVSAFSIEPLDRFLADAGAHFAACNAQGDG
ncbi:MAG: hypothetical protein J0L52_12700 [Caulobacterales bacterium]|nr:hypothetical protein [Caulobacterales bacterium]